MGDLFKSKKQTAEVSTVADPYKDVREKLTSWLGGQIGKSGQAYSGELTAPMPDYETASLKMLQDYANRGTSSSFTAAKKQAEDTLNGTYSDPTKSPYYQAIKAEAANNLVNTNKSINDTASGRGGFWTGARMSERNKAATNSATDLNKTLGALTDSERNRQVSMVPTAAELAKQEENAPLLTASALQSLGSLPRTIRQAGDTASYQDWLNANYQYPTQIAQLASGVQQAPLYGQTGYSQSPFSQIAGVAAQMLPYLLMM